MQSNLGKGVIIVGGGIGGLTTALALKQVGIQTRIFEQSGHMQPIGAGLLLAANAVKVLTKLGLGPVIQAMSVPQLKGGIYSWRGELLAETSGEALEQKFGALTLAVHRADLQAALLAALEPQEIELNAKLQSFEQAPTGVTARFTNGLEVQGSLLIGADGIHSVVRGQLFGAARPRYSGYTAWRAVTPFDHSRLRPGEYWGRGARFGIAPLSQGRAYWFATKNAPEGEKDAAVGRKPELLEIFQGWAEPIQALLEATEASTILRNDIYDRVPLKHWSQGRVTLLGDAAHPMTPNMGQGACQAIEDAVVLAECLASTADVFSALQQYEDRRIERTSAIVDQSWKIGRVAQWTNPLACWLRNKGLKLVPSDWQLKQLEPVLGYNV